MSDLCDPTLHAGPVQSTVPSRVVCGWCGRELQPGAEPASHGICDNCRFLFTQGTGAEEGRVAFFLGSDCTPTHHDIMHLLNGWSVCRLCGKQQSPDAVVCLVCNEPGEVPVRLGHVERGDDSVEGKLCRACLEDFEEKFVVCDWEVAQRG